MLTTVPDITTAVERIGRGELASIELVEFCLDRIQRYHERIRAWVVVDAEAARRQAERADEMAGRGQLMGPLHGIPLGIKDIIDVANFPTRAGSPLLANSMADQDAPLVTALRTAGAVILGKTVTTEFACFDPSPTRNPWNTRHTPGGSSSGSAAAVAAQMCLAALGSQTGGSITRPAIYCGVAGLKPTFGALPVEGIVPVSFHLDHPGPLARSAADLLAVWRALRGATAVSTDESQPPVRPPRFSLLEGYFRREADAEISRVTDEAVARLQDGGAEVTTSTLPHSFTKVHTMHRRIMAVDAAQQHRPTFMASRDQYGPHISALIEEGLAISAVDYATALNHQQLFRHDMQRLVHGDTILITPATNTAAPSSLETTGDPRFNSPWSYCGLPTVAIPCGLTTDGMPGGLQLIGASHREAELLLAAMWCERRLAFNAQPPL